MLIATVGVNHRTAPVEVREKLSFPNHNVLENLRQLYEQPGIEGCVIISTCNRTEIYVTVADLDEGINIVWNYLCKYSGLGISEIKNYTFSYTQNDAIMHLFRVSAGLDSMILGETQILGQVREAYENSLKAKTSNTILNTLFKQAIVVGKRVRTETGIDKNAVSVSYAAVELAKQKFGDLNGRSVLVVGAGKMSELTAKHLVANGVTGVIVSNRSYDRAVQLAEKFNGQAVNFAELYKHMKYADIVISSTAARHYVIRYVDILALLNIVPGKKIMLIDIAVPRDIDPMIGKLPGVSLYDIDDLQSVVDSNLEERRKAAILAEDIIEEELEEFMKWLSIQYVVPTITAFREMAEEIKQKELTRAYNRLGELTDRERKVISSMANSIVKQLTHFPTVRLKEYALTNEAHIYTEVLQNLFALEVPRQRKKNIVPVALKKAEAVEVREKIGGCHH